MSTLITTIIAAAIVNNLVFVQLVGVSSLFLFSKNLRHSIEFAGLAALVLFVSSFFSLLVHRWILRPLNLETLNLLVFMAVAVAVAIALIKILQQFLSLTAYRQEIAITLFSVSSAVIAVPLINITSLLPTWHLVIYCFGAALGYGLSIAAFAALRRRTSHSEVPWVMQGTPLDLISAGIIAMAFLGFAGLV